MTVRLLADPVFWAVLLMPLLALGEWYSATWHGHVGPALFLAGCAMALPVALRLALTPAWLSDLVVIVAAIFVAVLVHVRVGEWTGTHAASQPGSVVLFIPALAMTLAIVSGSIAQFVLTAWSGSEALRAVFEPLASGWWRTGAAVVVAVAAYADI